MSAIGPASDDATSNRRRHERAAQAERERAELIRTILPEAPTEPKRRVSGARVAIYARYSSERQRERSIERQVQLCREVIARCGFTEVAVYADSGKSGLTMFGRSELHRALADAEQGLYDILIVEDVDRLARKPSDAHYIQERLEGGAGGTVVAIHDLGGELQGMAYGIKVLLSAETIKIMKARMARGRRRMVEEGETPHKLKFGLMRASRGVYVPHPERSHAVVTIFRRYVKGVSRARIARDLTGRYPTPGDAYEIDAGRAPVTLRSLWTTAMVREIIKSFIYVGTLIDGMTRTMLDPERRKVGVSVRERGEWAVGKATHSRIVDDDLFLAANMRLRAERKISFLIRKGERLVAARTPTTANYLLHNRVSCGVCGGRAGFLSSNRREWAIIRCEHM